MAELTDTFVVHGACCTCSQGMRPSRTVLKESHGVFLRGQAQLTVKDCKGEINVICFGGCYSMENPSTQEEAEKIKKKIEEACPETFTDKVMNFFTGGKKKKKQEEASDNEIPKVVGVCTPRIIAREWDHGQDGVNTEEERPLMGGAKLYCMYGGEIEIVESGQPEAGSGTIEKKQDKSENNNMAEQLLMTAKVLGLGIANLGKTGIALALENMDAMANRRIHQLLNWDEEIKGNLQMGLSLIPQKSVKSMAGLFQNNDLKEMDLVITQYENRIYEKYKEQIDYYKEARDFYGKDKIPPYVMKIINDKFRGTDISKDLEEMGAELSSMEAVKGHKNDLVNFFNMVYTNNPIDLKSRDFKYPDTNESSDLSIWSAPWPKKEGGSFEKDYTGNWLYGYVGAEYFTTPTDDNVLKYGAGVAQLISDILNVKKLNDSEKEFPDYLKEVAAKYYQSLIKGNYGDNTNETGISDAEMIQEGINAYRAKKSK